MMAFLRKRKGLCRSRKMALAAVLLLAVMLTCLIPAAADVSYAGARQSGQGAGEEPDWRSAREAAQEDEEPEEVRETASKTDARVFDQAKLFSAKEKDRLEELTAQCRETTGMDIVILTAYNDNRRSAMEYADDYYDFGGFGVGKKASGALFLLYMDGPGSSHGDYWISTTGNMIRILTDKRIEEMGSHVVSDLKGKQYAKAAQTFLKDIEYYVNKGIVAGQYNYDTETGEISIYRSIRWYEALIAVMISATAGVLACLGVKNQYAMKPSRRQMDNSLAAYRTNAKYAMNTVQDTLVKQYVTHTRISSSSGGGGRGGSSGRSSTHRSSSGRSHGGGGGRF